jgi:hypothetical protein
MLSKQQTLLFVFNKLDKEETQVQEDLSWESKRNGEDFEIWWTTMVGIHDYSIMLVLTFQEKTMSIRNKFQRFINIITTI